jgi:hypothetical protein
MYNTCMYGVDFIGAVLYEYISTSPCCGSALGLRARPPRRRQGLSGQTTLNCDSDKRNPFTSRDNIRRHTLCQLYGTLGDGSKLSYW